MDSIVTTPINETAPVAPGTASEPKTPTSEVEPLESAHSVDTAVAGHKLHIPAEPASTKAMTRAESDALVEQMKAEYERERPLREAKSPFGWHEDKPMLTQKGAYPPRFAFEPTYWGYVARGDLQVSPWLADWENGLRRAGWKVTRKGTAEKTDPSLINDSCWAYYEDGDLFCPRRNIFVTLLPSKVPMSGSLISAVRELCRGYPGSFVVIHARDRKKHLFEPRDDDNVLNLLSAKSTAHCIDLKAVVEFEGILYEPDGPADEDGESTWHESENILAWQIYHEYRLHSLYYHKIQERADESRKRTDEIDRQMEAMSRATAS